MLVAVRMLSNLCTQTNTFTALLLFSQVLLSENTHVANMLTSAADATVALSTQPLHLLDILISVLLGG